MYIFPSLGKNRNTSVQWSAKKRAAFWVATLGILDKLTTKALPLLPTLPTTRITSAKELASESAFISPAPTKNEATKIAS